MARNEVKWGAILSYVLIIVNALYGLFLTPYMIGQLGEAEYGVYKTISSFTSALMVLDLGVGGTLMRYIARFKADKEDEKIPNFLAMSFIEAGLLSVIIGVIIGILYFFIDSFYSNGLTSAEIAKAKQLYIWLGVGVIAHIFSNVVNGIISGYNHFTFANGISIARLVFRILLIASLLQLLQDSLVIVIIDLAATLIFSLVEFFYIKMKLKVKVQLTAWDKELFKSSFKYAALLFITSVAAQINSNLDNVVIGAIIGAGAVTVYSVGLLIFGMFEQLSTAISSVMLPTVTNTLKNDDKGYTKTQDLIIQVGRVQFILLGAAWVGFAVIGKAFVQIWLGSGFEDVYPIVLILMTPSLLELCVNVCLSVLRANNKLGFRTCILLGTTILNAVITVIGTYFYGYYAAAVGTGVSFLLGSVIVMNIYYYKQYHFNMLRIYKKIFENIWICLLLSGIACNFVTLIFKDIPLQVITGIAVFCVVYGVTLLLFGLTSKEKSYLKILKIQKRREQND